MSKRFVIKYWNTKIDTLTFDNELQAFKYTLEHINIEKEK